MSRIRYYRLEGNQGGRFGTQVMSPYTAQVHYVTIEHGALHVRHWDTRDIGMPEEVSMAVTEVTACFSEPGKVCVTLSGYTPGGQDSILDTRVIAVKE